MDARNLPPSSRARTEVVDSIKSQILLSVDILTALAVEKRKIDQKVDNERAYLKGRLEELAGLALTESIPG